MARKRGKQFPKIVFVSRANEGTPDEYMNICERESESIKGSALEAGGWIAEYRLFCVRQRKIIETVENF